ncbi:hypothetical protein AAFN47_24790 [Hoeflea sp. CAU 1731]
MRSSADDPLSQFELARVKRAIEGNNPEIGAFGLENGLNRVFAGSGRSFERRNIYAVMVTFEHGLPGNPRI